MVQIFKVHWTEPSGRLDRPFHEDRIFIVVRPHFNARHSLCVYVNPFRHRDKISCSLRYRPIHTYKDKGTAAPHARAHDHVVIYAGEKPVLVEGEHGSLLQKLTISATLRRGQDLRVASRVNFLKLHTVEHNIHVLNMGEISVQNAMHLRQYCGLGDPTITAPSINDGNT